MRHTTSVLDSFPVETRLASPEAIPAVRSSYHRIRGFFDRLEFEARLREAAARGWIVLPSQGRRQLTPIVLPGRPLSELLREVRD